MNELVPVGEHEIDGKVQPSVDARELHSFLEVETQFRDWIKRRIEEAQLVENIDFIITLKNERNSRGAPSKEYVLTLDSGKDVSLLERNEKGRIIRRYFIECEKQYTEIINNEEQPTTKSVVDQMALKLSKEQQFFMIGYQMSGSGMSLQEYIRREMKASKQMARHQFGLKGNQVTLAATNHIRSMYGINLMESQGNPPLISEEKEALLTATQLGKRLGGLSPIAVNKLLDELGFHYKNEGEKEWTITQKGRKHGEMLDTTKRHTIGTPIKQWKWYERVAEILRKESVC